MPRSCSRITYRATCSSAELCWKRNEKRFLKRGHETRLYPRCMRRRSREGRFAERTLVGVDDAGEEERIVLWIERRAGGVWAVARAVNPHLRESDETRPDDVIFEGYELDDALARANEALEDDVVVLEARRPRGGREAVHAQGGAPAPRALVLQPLTTVPRRADRLSSRRPRGGASLPRFVRIRHRPQSRSRRRVHVLGADDGPRGHARPRVRAGPRRTSRR